MVRSLATLMLVAAFAVTTLAQLDSGQELTRKTLNNKSADAGLLQLLEKYEQSVNDLNLELAEEIWSQDSAVSFIHPRGHEHGWPDIKQKFYLQTMGGLPTRHLRLRDIKIYPLTEDAAWAEFCWDFEAKRPNGMELKSSGRETQVFKRENGAWQIQHVHYSGMPTLKEGEGF